LLPEQWSAFQSPNKPSLLPRTWLDDTASWTTMPRRTEITAKNKKMLELALQHIL
jgi:acetoin utilization protein AcuC